MRKTTAFTTETSARDLVAGEVRAELARRKLNSNNLPEFVGKSQTYWNQRLNSKISFSIDDIAALSYALDVPMTHFIPAVVPDIDPEMKNGPTAGAVRPVKLPELDSNQQPAGSQLGNVYTLPIAPTNHQIEHANPAPIIKLFG